MTRSGDVSPTTIHQAKLDAMRRVRSHGGVPTFFDALVLAVPEHAEDEASRNLRRRLLTTLRSAGRGDEDPLARLARTPGTDLPGYTRSCSQGTGTPTVWQGRTLFKSVFDLGLYQQLLQRVRPATVIEIGSGSGGSALWFRSMGTAIGSPCRVVSVDLTPPPDADDDGVTFLRGDTAALADTLPPDVRGTWERPWLVVEDAHIHVPAVLGFFDPLLRPGDCLVVEDSLAKQETLRDFLTAGTHAAYMADSALLDLYGVNATSAVNSVWHVTDRVGRPDLGAGADGVAPAYRPAATVLPAAGRRSAVRPTGPAAR
ncbi:CmcI family methyltransferase [Streptomyces chattanoogensis]